MSRPRKPFGANHPGRLPATMMKVLAAEMSDPSRLRRGKQYAKDGSVLDIIIEPGVVTCEIQGSRSTPYVTSLTVSVGSGMPLRRDVATQCTCPDDDNWDNYACKHAVAAMFTFSDELLLQPELLDLWRGMDPLDVGALRPPGADDAGFAPRDDHHADDPDRDDLDGADSADVEPDRAPLPERRRGHLRLVREGERAPAPAAPAVPAGDRLAGLLEVPAEAALPDVPRLTAFDAPDPANRLLADAVRDARSHLRLDWD